MTITRKEHILRGRKNLKTFLTSAGEIEKNLGLSTQATDERSMGREEADGLS